MFKIISKNDISEHEYAGEGCWVATGGLRFNHEADALAQLEADRARINPRIRATINVVAA